MFVLTCLHGQTGGVSLDYIAQGFYPNKTMHDAYVSPAGEMGFLLVQVGPSLAYIGALGHVSCVRSYHAERLKRGKR